MRRKTHTTLKRKPRHVLHTRSNERKKVYGKRERENKRSPRDKNYQISVKPKKLDPKRELRILKMIILSNITSQNTARKSQKGEKHAIFGAGKNTRLISTEAKRLEEVYWIAFGRILVNGGRYSMGGGG